MDYQKIIDKYYPEDDDLRRLLIIHSRQVADRCLLIAKKHPELKLDSEFLEEAAMLHDIGIRECDAPGIHCHGTEPYIRHGIMTAWDIEQQQLPLPHEDFMPEELEEQVVCYADKFYSKTRPDSERTVVEAMRALEKFGWDGIKRFQKWVDMFE